MKILVDGMPREKGGIGSLILNLADWAQNKDEDKQLDFEFIIAGRSCYLPHIEKEGYKYYIAPSVHDLIAYNRFLRGLFENNHYDYLWFNNTSKVNIMLPAYAKARGVKLIAHPHGVDSEEKGLKGLVFKMLDALNARKMFSLIDIPFACSEEAADFYYNGSTELRERTTIIHNGIDTDAFTFDEPTRQKVRKELNMADNEILLGAVGRLTSVKNYPFIIELLHSLDPHYKLIILGDGEDRGLLESLVNREQLGDRCFLSGSKSNVQDYLFAMDLFLMPSFNEGMPYSIIEAQCSGLPCIVSDSLAPALKITDLVEFVSIQDSKKWVEAICGNNKKVDRKGYAREVYSAGYGVKHSYLAFKQAIGVEKYYDQNR